MTRWSANFFFFFEKRRHFHYLRRSLQSKARMDSGASFRHIKPAVWLADLANTWATSLQFRLTKTKEISSKLFLIILMSWTIAPIWDLSRLFCMSFRTKFKQSEAITTFLKCWSQMNFKAHRTAKASAISGSETLQITWFVAAKKFPLWSRITHPAPILSDSLKQQHQHLP